MASKFDHKEGQREKEEERKCAIVKIVLRLSDVRRRESSKNKQNHHSAKGGEWREKCFMREKCSFPTHHSTTTISSIKFFVLLAHLSLHNVKSTEKAK